MRKLAIALVAAITVGPKFAGCSTGRFLCGTRRYRRRRRRARVLRRAV